MDKKVGCLGIALYLLLIPVLWYAQAFTLVTVLGWHFPIEITLVQAWIGMILLEFAKPNSLMNYYSLESIKKKIGADEADGATLASSLTVRFAYCATVLFLGWVVL